MRTLTDKAKRYACKYHHEQTRKYTDLPYIIHPAAVAMTVYVVGGNQIEVAAAWLHDLIEDTCVTKEHLLHDFGTQVAEIVDELTNTSKKSDGTRAERKRMDRERFANASPAAKTIKLADRLDNVPSIVAYAPDFARKYVPETALLLPYLEGGNAQLFDAANWMVESFTESLRLGAATGETE